VSVALLDNQKTQYDKVKCRFFAKSTVKTKYIEHMFAGGFFINEQEQTNCQQVKSKYLRKLRTSRPKQLLKQYMYMWYFGHVSVECC
jgi:hypothetical protein